MTQFSTATARVASLAIALLCGLTACTMPTSVTSTWHEPIGQTKPLLDTVLVVGVSDASRQRNRFENAMAARLESSGLTAWPSNRVMKSDVELNRETVTAVVEQTGAKSVLVTRLVNQEISTEQIDERTGHKTRRKNETPIDFFRYDYDEYEEPAYLIVKTTVSLTTDLYETTGGKLFYSMDTTTYEKESAQEILDEVIAAIVTRLKRDGLIK